MNNIHVLFVKKSTIYTNTGYLSKHRSFSFLSATLPIIVCSLSLRFTWSLSTLFNHLFRMHFVSTLVCLISLSGIQSASVSSLECGACSLLVTHFELKIAAVDPKKKIEVGSFRVSPTGDQKGLKEIGYARSESHLTEIIEHACDDAKHYKLVVNTITGKSVYVHNDATHLKGDESPKMRYNLQNACNDFIDSHEDELLGFLKTAHQDPVKQFCQGEMGACTAVDVAPLPAAPEEPMDLSDIPDDEIDRKEL